jgi:energy-coupling factor transport system ATP-binding protein
VLNDTHLALSSGAVGGILGPSGSGKTTLLHTISGLLPWLRPGQVDGTLELDGQAIGDLDPGQRAHLLASCLDRPFTQLFLSTPREEVAAARRLYGDSPLLDVALDEFNLRPLLDRRTAELSSGERQRLALTVALAGCPRPVLVDEPTAHLDGDGVAAFHQLLELARHEGGSVLLSEHAGWSLGQTVRRWWAVQHGELRDHPTPAAPQLPAPPHERRAEDVITLRDVAVERGGRPLLEGVDLSIRGGEIVVISGANGSGKSTLAEVVAGFRRPRAGAIEAAGQVALMLPIAELQLFATTVADEVAVGGGHEPRARVLRRHRLEHLAARAPWTLSRGERQRLVHAALDLQRPRVMVVDEPAQGLDPQELSELVGLIHRRAERGRAYLVISHRQELAAAAHRHLRVEERRLVQC